MGRLPANNLPPGSVWQAMQSPARARYCPLLTAGVAGGTSLAARGGVLRLPHANGGARAPAGRGLVSGRAGKLESQAASEVTSASDSRLATICMQSGAVAVRVP